jgi:List-Bact-rpt repeat protein
MISAINPPAISSPSVRSRLRHYWTVLSCIGAILSIGAGVASGAVIHVTTTEQKISSSGGCSLQEAIYSADFDNNVAIAGYNGSTPIEVVTQCVPGSGPDIIVLPAGARFQMSKIVDDAINPTGPAATPIITSDVTVLGYGATLERIGTRNLRLFAVGPTGHLTIRKAYVRGFRAQGGDGGATVKGWDERLYVVGGGGGGMGAGGAIYVMGGVLVIEASTFEGNVAQGGQGGLDGGGGGGGMGGSGGPGSVASGGGGGGGGARGNGGGGAVDGGGGGGTESSGQGGATRKGGFDCGGDGGSASDGHDGRCMGGGGGGGGDDFTYEPIFFAKNGGAGQYGGGGGGGADHGNGGGGRGGFGGGGGAAHINFAFCDAADGGDGGFGAGGGGGGESFTCFDGNGGKGGFFGGGGGDGSGGGGGGAGLGGAIFNQSGTVDIRNSTFTNNFVNGGFSASSQDGSGGGGAIFSVNGSLTVLNSTISGNFGNFGGGIMVVQDSASAPTSFVLENTILANNGEYVCAITGSSIGVAFAGNLIENNTPDGSEKNGHTFVGCQGVVSTANPQLGPLQYNQGATPTMAIGSTSPARNAADPTTSLSVDQRKQPRPANGGYDIGAFELCLEGFGNLEHECLILAGIEDPGGSNQAVQLTILAQPPGSGTTIPASGLHDVPKDSVVALNATPSAGFRFTSWSENTTNPLDPSTTVVMGGPQTVTATFAACKCAAEVTSSIGFSAGAIVNRKKSGRYEQTVTLTNTSPNIISGPVSLVLDRVSEHVAVLNADGETTLMAPTGSPYVDLRANLAPGQSVAVQLRFENPVDDVVTYTPRVLAGKGAR